MIPARTVIVTASSRGCAPSLPRIDCTELRTVQVVLPSAVAIARLVPPRATWRSVSSSRGVRSAPERVGSRRTTTGDRADAGRSTTSRMTSARWVPGRKWVIQTCSMIWQPRMPPSGRNRTFGNGAAAPSVLHLVGHDRQ